MSDRCKSDRYMNDRSMNDRCKNKKGIGTEQPRRKRLAGQKKIHLSKAAAEDQNTKGWQPKRMMFAS